MASVDLSKHTVNLSKGEKINLSKAVETPGLNNVMIGLGWDPAEPEAKYQTVTETIKPGFIGRLLGKQERTVTHEKLVSVRRTEDIDCDVWVAMLHNGRLESFDDVVYYGRKDYYNQSGVNAIHHHGDNLTGEGEGDDEQVTIRLEDLPKKWDGLVIGVTIYQGFSRGQSFGDIKNTFIRVVDERNNFEICRFDQKEMSENKDALTFIAGKLYRDKGEWQFTAVGKCTMDKDIRNAVQHYKYK